LTEVIILANALTDDATLEILPAPLVGQSERDEALSRQNLVPIGEAKEINLTTQGTLESATLILPFDSTMIPSLHSVNQARLARYNPQQSAWEVQEEPEINGNTLKVQVTGFSVYMPVLLKADVEAVLKEVYAYPNPAVSPDDPVIRAKLGIVDEVQITIFDVTGQKVHSASMAGSPDGIIDGEYYYDYVWSDSKASGVYFAVVHGKGSQGIVRGKVRFAVVR